MNRRRSSASISPRRGNLFSLSSGERAGVRANVKPIITKNFPRPVGGYAHFWIPLVLLLSLAAARAQYNFSDQNSAASVSGQFQISTLQNDAPVFKDESLRDPNLAANTNIVRLKTALLAVAAERFKLSLWTQLGLQANASWSGKIYLRVHTARSLNETVTIAANPFLNRWNYLVDLPDTLWKSRYARALSGVMLLELANRLAKPGGHTAELPDWLVDGLAQHVLAADGEKVVLSAPVRKIDVMPVTRINQVERGLDPLASARTILQTLPPLTFDQLSWPTDAQMNGRDGGAYLASVQLFQAELIGLPNGREKMRNFIADLPNHLNWQTTFFLAFSSDFQHPLDVEKWWALRLVNFASREPGPRWTTEVSLARLQQLMSVAVEYRSQSNALPAHAEISLQDALKSLSPAQRDMVVRTKARDLALVELRLAPPFGGIADGYRLALNAYLGESKPATRGPVTNKHAVATVHKASLADTLKKLDQLDRQRRDAETRSNIPLRGNR